MNGCPKKIPTVAFRETVPWADHVHRKGQVISNLNTGQVTGTPYLFRYVERMRNFKQNDDISIV